MKHLVFCLLIAAAYALSDYTYPNYGLTAGDTATAYFLKEAASTSGAVCLDGTPGAYYHRPGTGSGVNKWYIHHQGGGWCESEPDCYGRSQGELGSSKTYPPTADLSGGYFDISPSINPQMYNWNAVYLRYCDGGSFSGNNETVSVYNGHRLFYRGFRVLNAMFDDLYTNRKLSQATDVVISGCSAGGLATYLHVDWWRNKLPSQIKVRGMPDSGFFLDYQGPPRYHSGMMWVFQQMNSTSGVNQDCIAAYESTKEEWKCIFAEHTAPHIKTPIFPLQAEYDSWQVDNDLDSKDPKIINTWGQNLTSLIKNNLLNQPQHGIFLDSCLHHCGEWGNIVIDGMNQAQAFEQWYNGGSKRFFNQNQAYPCTTCCRP